jgi:hypothetical protein
MSDHDLSEICFRFKAKLSQAFVERLEKSLGEDFEYAVKSDSKKVLLRILQDIHLYYVTPYEMVLETGQYLKEVHQIPDFSIALSTQAKIDFGERIPQIRKFVESFYSMVTTLGFEEELRKHSTRWWKR